MSGRCDIAIIGAGPYGLSLAAHLGAAGIDFRIFGRPLNAWREHMPKDMMLKSDGFASNISAPDDASTLRAWCARHDVVYANQGLPVSLDTFIAYGAAFQKRYVPGLEEVDVARVERNAEGFTLRLANGESVSAKHVVVATGISHFAYTPSPLSQLSGAVRSHTYDHRGCAAFRGKDVVIVGAGASATNLAAHLSDCGATARIVARSSTIAYNSVPDPDAETLLYRIRRPASGIGRGWRSYFCAAAPLLFYRLPEALRMRGVQSHSHPAAGWFMREKVEGRVEALVGRSIANAEEKGSRVSLTLLDRAGRHDTITCDHVVAATGYRSDTRRFAFLSPELRARIASERHTPLVSDSFETPVAGLYVTGPAVIDSFGPLMRFMVGADFAAPRLSQHLARRVGARLQRKAA
jgi:thioredoxin reductase